MRYIFPKDDPDQTLRPVIMPGLYQSDTVKDNDPFYSLTYNQFWFEVEMSHNEVYIRLRGQCHLEWETYAGESQYTTFLKAENTSLKLSWLSNTAFFSPRFGDFQIDPTKNVLWGRTWKLEEAIFAVSIAESERLLWFETFKTQPRIYKQQANSMSSASFIVKALLTRSIFAGHIIVSVWWVVQLTRNTKLWNLAFFEGLLFLETLFSVFYRGGQEFKW